MKDAFLLSTSKITKVFGSHVALSDVDFGVLPGEVHGVLGENGAGKSTLMNILYGLYQPTKGGVLVDGMPVQIRSPADSIRLGIGMVHQQSTLVPSFDAAENFLMGTRTRGFDLQQERSRISELARKYEMPFPTDIKVGSLDVGMRQKIEIVRALYRGARVLILDEPTTFLVEREFLQLKQSLRTLAGQGFAVILITHKIREVLAACDKASVLRKGKLQGTIAVAAGDADRLVKLMFEDQSIGVNDAALPRIHVAPRAASASVVLELKGVSTKPSDASAGLKGLDLQIHAGEILGVAGIEGQKDLAEAIIHPGKIVEGEVLFKGHRLNDLDTAAVFQAGIAYTPEDRVKEGILPTGPITFNVLLPHHAEPRFRQGRVFMGWEKAASVSRDVIREFKVAALDEKVEMRRLSGGNMQKVILGRALVNPVALLITHNPSSGLDISSLEFIFARLVELRDAGRSVLFLNEDLDELMLICDRIAVLHGGRIVGVRDRTKTSKLEIGALMTEGR